MRLSWGRLWRAQSLSQVAVQDSGLFAQAAGTLISGRGFMIMAGVFARWRDIRAKPAGESMRRLSVVRCVAACLAWPAFGQTIHQGGSHGIMYTTWVGDYSKLAQFMKIAKEFTPEPGAD